MTSNVEQLLDGRRIARQSKRAIHPERTRQAGAHLADKQKRMRSVLDNGLMNCVCVTPEATVHLHLLYSCAVPAPMPAPRGRPPRAAHENFWRLGSSNLRIKLLSLFSNRPRAPAVCHAGQVALG